MEEIRICEEHDEEVPLIWTFAFAGAEYWCPFCGYTGGMFGSGMIVKETPEIVRRGKYYRQLSKEFLDAKSTIACSSLVWKGKEISPDDLPQEEKDRVDKVASSWKYGQSFTELKGIEGPV